MDDITTVPWLHGVTRTGSTASNLQLCLCIWITTTIGCSYRLVSVDFAQIWILILFITQEITT